MAQPADQLWTERLSGRPFSPADWPLLHALLCDPASARWLTRTRAPDVDEGKARAAAEAFAESWRAAGVGPFLWRLGPTAIGYAGLRRSRLDSAGGWEAIWAIDPAYWGRGFATEAARAALADFDAGPDEAVWTWTLPDNVASRRVMDKLGFQRSHDAEWAGLPHVVYRL